jgi:hypothetical protein
MAYLADQPNTAVERDIAKVNQRLISWRVVPLQRSFLIRKANDHAVVICALSDEQFPRSEDDDFHEPNQNVGPRSLLDC